VGDRGGDKRQPRPVTAAVVFALGIRRVLIVLVTGRAAMLAALSVPVAGPWIIAAGKRHTL
jgi:hypothetical protein